MKAQRLFSYVRRATDDYNMINDGDKIAVGISGGKDSLTLLYALNGLKRFYPKKFDVVAITVDLDFGIQDFSKIEKYCNDMDIEYYVVKTEIANVVFNERQESNPCSLCAKMRKGALNDFAKSIGCNKIALGHHYDDVIETILMGMLYGAQVQTMMPKLHSTNFEGMELIRPLYLIREADIIHWANYNDLHFIQCACRFTEHCASCGGTEKGSKRAEIKELIHELAQKDPVIEYNIFRSVENVNLNTVIGYKQDGVRHNFLDTYDDVK